MSQTRLITHLRTSDTRYRAALPAEFCAQNPPPMYITLYYIVTRLPDSLCLVRDYFLSVCPTTLTVDLLEQCLLAAETSIVAVGASRGDPRTPVFEGCSPSPLLRSVASAAAADLGGFESVGAASAPSGRRRTGRGKGGKGTGGTGGGGGGGGGGSGGGWGGGGRGGGGGGVGSSSGGGGGGGGGGGSGGGRGGGGGGGGGGSGGAGRGSTQRSGSSGGQRQQQQCSRETPSPQQLREWYAGRQRGGGTGPCTYVLRTGDRAGEQCGGLHSTQRSFGRLTDVWRHQFPDATEIPRWGDLSRAGVAIFDLDYDAILAAMYAVSTSDEGDCYLCVPPDPGGEAAALGASEAAALGASASAAQGAGESALSGTASAQVFHTFTLDSGASRSFFRDRTTLTPLSRPVAVSLADPSGGPVLDQGVDQFTPASQRVTHCTCARTGRHVATFTRRPGSSLNILSTESPPVPASGQVAASSQVFAAGSGSSPESAPCSCRLLSHQTLLWHHRLGHPSLPRLRGMASRVLLVSNSERVSVRTFLFCVCTLTEAGSFPSAQGIRQIFSLPASPQQNGIAEHRIGMVMDVARTSMIHAAAPHFLWPFAVQYAAHQLNLQPRVSLPETSPTLRWTGKDVTFDESVPYYHLFPYCTAPLPPSPLFLAPGPPPVDPLPPQGPAPSGVSQVDAVKPVEVVVDSGAARGAEPVGAGSGGAESGGAEPMGAESGGAEPGGSEPGGTESRGAEPGGAESGGAESARVASRSASLRRELLSPLELREWFAWRWSRVAGAGGPPVAPGPGGARPGGTGAVGTGGAAAAAGVGPAGASGAAGAGATGGVGARVGAAVASGAAGAGAAGGVGTGVGPTGGTAGAACGTGAAGPAEVGAVGAGGVLLAQVLGLPPSPGPAPPLECPQPVQSQSPLQPVSPLPAPSPYAGPTGGLAERREPASRPTSPVRTTRTSRRAPRPRPPAVPGTHQMTLRPSTAPLRVPLPSPLESSLPVLADPASHSLRAASPTVARLLSTVVTDPSFESTAASALVAELVDFAARCRLDYTTRLVAESESVCPPSVEGECALSTDILEDRQEEFQCFAAALPHLSTMDAEMASWKSIGTYVNEVPPPGANIVDGMWIFRVKRPPGSPPVFKARYVARGFIYGLRQAPREWHDTLRTTLAALGFAPSTADPSLFLRTDTSLPPFYILVYVDDLVFATADTAGLAHVKSELQKRHTCTDLGELRSYLGLQITRDRAQCTITLTQSHMVQQVLQRFDFTYSSPQATPLSTRHSLSALPSDESVEPSGPYPELVGCLMYLMTYTRPDLAYPLSILARYVAPGRHRPEHMAAAKRVLRYLCITSGLGLVLGGRHPVVLTGHADASWADDQATQRSSQGYTFSLGSGSELRWLTYLLTNLGEPPRSPPVLYVDNKAMLALCREHRLEHRTKHIALRYFLPRELQHRGQLRLAYVASEANTANIFTKALPPSDHQRFCTMLGLVPTWPHLLTS
ncbi:unnamed protein product [Closterium sp. NIES-54]